MNKKITSGKKINYLKWMRVVLALLFFVPILLFFVDFLNLLPDKPLSWFLRVQLVPLVLSGTIFLLILHALLAWVFGRIYCSTLCPLGVLQDIIGRISNLFRKKRKRKWRFKYAKPNNMLRYGLLVLTILVTVFFSNTLLLLVDPYSNFGRIATHLIRPLFIEVNNILAAVLAKADNYTLYHVSLSTITLYSILFALGLLVLLVVLVVWRGRLFCNTLCPVGAALSLSRRPLFRMVFDKESCTQCGLCERTCKAEAISATTQSIDPSRCVVCFNCLSTCQKGGVSYQFHAPFKSSVQADKLNLGEEEKKRDGRRVFLSTGLVLASSLPTVSYAQKHLRKRNKMGGDCLSDSKLPITPPGSLSVERFKDKCTACHLCVVHCPSQILKPAGMEYGFNYLLKPHMSYDEHFCNYECTICADVCPTEAIKPIGVEEKTVTQVGVAHFMKRLCIVHTDGTDCGACSEHCPTQAVHMVPYKGTLTIPKVEPELCVGCGGCESICPVRPDRAIVVRAHSVHQVAKKPEVGEEKKVELDDFGF